MHGADGYGWRCKAMFDSIDFLAGGNIVVSGEGGVGVTIVGRIG